ncbi:amino acid deaminase [Knoellia koreensis]|uniref:Amino acid deaminase n=1 Tax=Knoellia koreensis TaxID=2730921 RepID=A0A849HD89_9MICO|nr:amino acid deaminase [Knoellia sp. DB2414S]
MNLDDIESEVLDFRYKGVPLGESLPLRELGSRGWNVARGDLSLPVTTLRAEALTHNIETMAEYCRRRGVSLAPHGKTTMSPQLFQRQLDAGAWGITAGTPGQVQVMRRFGVQRVFLANELVERQALEWVAAELSQDEDFDFYCLVDSVDTVAAMDEVLHDRLGSRRLNVLVELGLAGGRTGTRSVSEALAVSGAVVDASTLRLAGVETFEGLAASSASPDDIAAVDRLLGSVRDVVQQILEQRAPSPTEEFLVTAGGSVFFDRVVEILGSWPDQPQVRVVLRSGCYVSHDHGRYQRLSPLDGRRAPSEDLCLENALEAWGVVLSRPEPTQVIVGSGKRDLPYDVELPIPLRVHRADGEVFDLTGASVTKLMDQHAFLTVPESVSLEPGDIVAFGLSHPCAAFDRAPLIPLIDEDLTVTGGVLTYF